MLTDSLLWISGWGESAEIFQPAAAASGSLSRSRFEASLSFFQPGDLFPAFRSQASERLEMALRSFDTPPLVIGWSLGASLALEVAERSPSTLSALMLVSPALRFVAPREEASLPDQWWVANERSRFEEFRAGVRRAPVPALKAFYRTSGASSRLSTGDAEKVVKDFGPVLDTGLLYLFEMDLRRQLRNLRIPTVVVLGDRDRVIPANPNYHSDGRLSIITIPGAGHRLPATHPAEIGLLVRMLRSGVEGACRGEAEPAISGAPTQREAAPKARLCGKT